MKKVENQELKLNLLNQTYYDNYLFKLEQRDPKYFKEVMDNYIIFQTDDNYYIVINIQKPSIHKDLWFDDEQPIPEKSEELFIQYNLQINGSRLNLGEDIYIYNGYRVSTKDNLVSIGDSWKSDKIRNLTYKRDLTEAEKAEIKSIFDILLDSYIERLKKYYKRYSDKVHCRGYWVNR